MAKKKKAQQSNKQEKCTAKEEQFAREFLVDLSIIQSAIRAGYKERSARKIGWEVFYRPRVQRRIQELMQERQKRTEITANNVLKEIAKIGFCDLKEAFDENGDLKDVKDIPDNILAAISNVKIVTNPAKEGEDITYTKELKLWDKKGALELLGKHLGLFTEKIDLSGELTVIGTGYPDNK